MSDHYTSKSGESREILVWKERGETLAVLLQRVRMEEGIVEEVPMTYAGRLDPMAEGQVLVLAGEARFSKEERLTRSKTYYFEILLGIATDTYDVLGLPTIAKLPLSVVPSDEEVKESLCVIGRERLPYPPYSSKPVGSTPLFAHARSGAPLPDIPLQRATAGSIALINCSERLFGELVTDIVRDVGRVEGDFRQKEIQKAWQELAERFGTETAALLSCEATVPAGVYVRSIAHALGKKIGSGALAYRIVRKAIL